ncbi:MAG: Holliday junction branch migration protein RuvA [Desulfurobacteriaceae bacterium]
MEFLKGKVVSKSAGYVVVECGCFGIKVIVPSKLCEKVKEGKDIFLFTKLVFPQEGTPVIYGFESMEERNLFEILIRIPKVGSKVALSIISSFDIEELKKVVLSNDVKALSQIPGLGKKLSERVILELRERFSFETENNFNEVMEALTSLGYSKKEILEVLNGIDFENLSFQEVVKIVAKELSGKKF